MTDDNERAWSEPEVIERYRDFSRIGPGEAAVFREVAARRRGGKILELGVGGGRITPLLLSINGDYRGLDYSAGMVALCRRRFPGAAFETGDARALDGLPAAAFDLVVFSFNGLDYASHADRQRILATVARRLKPGGEFVFSSHNLGMADYDRLPIPLPPLDRRLASGLRRLAKGLARHAWLKTREVRTAGYAIINEPELDYSLMTYYVRVEEQKRQLRAAGFTGNIDVFNQAGEKASSDDKSRFLYYAAGR